MKKIILGLIFFISLYSMANAILLPIGSPTRLDSDGINKLYYSSNGIVSEIDITTMQIRSLGIGGVYSFSNPSNNHIFIGTNYLNLLDLTYINYPNLNKHYLGPMLLIGSNMYYLKNTGFISILNLNNSVITDTACPNPGYKKFTVKNNIIYGAYAGGIGKCDISTGLVTNLYLTSVGDLVFGDTNIFYTDYPGYILYKKDYLTGIPTLVSSVGKFNISPLQNGIAYNLISGSNGQIGGVVYDTSLNFNYTPYINSNITCIDRPGITYSDVSYSKKVSDVITTDSWTSNGGVVSWVSSTSTSSGEVGSIDFFDVRSLTNFSGSLDNTGILSFSSYLTPFTNPPLLQFNMNTKKIDYFEITGTGYQFIATNCSTNTKLFNTGSLSYNTRYNLSSPVDSLCITFTKDILYHTEISKLDFGLYAKTNVINNICTDNVTGYVTLNGNSYTGSIIDTLSPNGVNLSFLGNPNAVSSSPTGGDTFFQSTSTNSLYVSSCQVPVDSFYDLSVGPYSIFSFTIPRVSLLGNFNCLFSTGKFFITSLPTASHILGIDKNNATYTPSFGTPNYIGFNNFKFGDVLLLILLFVIVFKVFGFGLSSYEDISNIRHANENFKSIRDKRVFYKNYYNPKFKSNSSNSSGISEKTVEKLVYKKSYEDKYDN